MQWNLLGPLVALFSQNRSSEFLELVPSTSSFPPNNSTSTYSPLEIIQNEIGFERNWDPDVLRIGTIDSIPFAFPCSVKTMQASQDLDCLKPGISPEYLHFVLQYSKTKYELVERTAVPFWGAVRPTPKGLYRRLLSGEIDTVAVIVQNSFEYDLFEYSYPVYQVEPLFLTAQPSVSFVDSALLVFRVFTIDLWAAFFLVMVAIVLFIYITPKVTNRRGMNPEKMEYRLWEYFRFCMDQCYYDMRQPTYSGNAAVVILGLLVVLWISLYQGCLLTQLLHPPKANSFESSAQMISLIKAGDYKMITLTVDDWYFKEAETSNDSYFVNLRSALEENPVVIEQDLDRLLDLVELGGYIYPVDQIRAKYILRKRCRLTTVSGADLPKRWFSFIFRRGSKWVKLLNLPIIMTQNYVPKLLEKYTAESMECKQVSSTGSARVEALNLLSMIGLYFVSIAGCLVGLGVFLVEKIYAPAKKTIHKGSLSVRKITFTNGRTEKKNN